MATGSLRLTQITATREHLRQLVVARSIVLAVVLAGASLKLADGGHAALAGWPASLFALAVLLNACTWLRLLQPEPVSHPEFLLQILCDVVLLGAALHHSGGDSSPFMVMYFVPLTIAAATLPWRQTLAVVAAVVVIHEMVCVYLPGSTEDVNRSADVLALVAAILVAFFTHRMAQSSREHEEELNQVREDYLRQRHRAELGAMAATAADQLGSPLATMAIATEELRSTVSDLDQDKLLEILAHGIEACKRISSHLTVAAGSARAEGGAALATDRFISALVEKCRLMQPWLSVTCRHEGPAKAPRIVVDAALEQALLVFLQGRPGQLRRVSVLHSWDEKALRIRICGAARAASRLDQLMARAAIHRFGGSVVDTASRDEGDCIELQFPLSALAACA